MRKRERDALSDAEGKIEMDVSGERSRNIGRSKLRGMDSRSERIEQETSPSQNRVDVIEVEKPTEVPVEEESTPATRRVKRQHHDHAKEKPVPGHRVIAEGKRKVRGSATAAESLAKQSGKLQIR